MLRDYACGGQAGRKELNRRSWTVADEGGVRMDPEESVEGLRHQYESGKLSRRSALKAAFALGVSTPALASVLAACGGASKSATGSSASPGNGTGLTPVDTVISEAKSGGSPVVGGTLVEGYDRIFSPITTINAAWIDPTQDALLESLVTTDPAGKLVPKLAQSFILSPDAKTLTFKLREGLKFQSGAPLTAQNVVTDWNLVRGKTGQDPYWYVQVNSIQAGPGNTVVIECDRPFASGPYLYRQQFANIFNNAAATANPKTYGTATVDGSGPFRLTAFNEQQVTAKRFEGYPGSIVPFFSNKGKAYLAGIKWVALTDQASRAAEVISGSVHVTKNPSPASLPSLRATPDLVVIEEEEAGGLCFALSFKRPQLGFTDVRVRQAISHAVDRQLIVKSVLFGQGTAVQGPFPTTYKWYEPGVEKFNDYSPSKANALLDAAGWTKGTDGIRAKNGQKLQFTITNRSDATLNEVGQAVVQMLAQVGISVKVDNLETGAYFNALTSDPDAYFFDWLWLDFPRIYQVLASKPFFDSSTWGQMSVPQCEAAFDAWSFAANDAQLEAAARQIQLTVAQYQPILTLYIPHVVWVHTNKLHGYLPTNPNNLYPYYNDMWLEA